MTRAHLPRWFLLAALLAAALNLRAPLAALAPVVDDVATGLALSPAGAGLLTSVPVLCFALCTPVASTLVARVGPERAVGLALVAVLAGTVLRSAGSVPAALAGTAVLGVGIAVGNVAVPVVITRDFHHRAGSVTGAYTAVMNVGSTATTVLTVPLAAALGWQWALAGWGLMAVVALVVWVPAGRDLGAQHAAGTAPRVLPHDLVLEPEQRRAMRRLAAVLAVAFGAQAGGYYAMTAWLPEILQDRLGLGAAAAGGAAAPFQLCAVAGSLLVPIALARGRARRVAAAVSLLWLALPLGLLVAPGAWLVWICLAGAGQGAAFTVIFTVLAQRSPSVAAARRASAVVQTAGYAFAALAPTLVGALHGATHGWTVPLLAVTGLITAMTVALLTAARPPR
ncbi:MFS transporter [Isoptericola variabilis]|uniref:Major facilitator superfamily MFS_1 n=1 Tax=Isoptericola variabilis (strain 225) TaxID=743718 RepID=F6FSQ5_ISOV2|nr:MFS transporter [Isoptericola variabilis]AEG45217.1 major facilitator superfamily MFS_1 [Isoptericola variabilis 225]